MSSLLSKRLRNTTEPRFEADWNRQRHTAEDILQRLQHQEGVILADQVGMGKTYVALAVAVSEILSTPELGQVVIFVPAAIAAKWVREWQKFSETLLEAGTEIRCVPRAIRSGDEFLNALDDPPERKNHIVVVTHTALTASLKNSFVQLALLHYATRHRRDGAELRRRIAKWCTGRSGLLRHAKFTTDRVACLLDASPRKWKDTWERLTGEQLADDPVPAALDGAARNLHLDDLRAVIASLPVRKSANITKHLEMARKELGKVTQETWEWILSSTELSLPLLIVDEAHRLKNGDTQISKLFAPRSEDRQAGAFAGVFQRMLFLTATPFELGHAELVKVLSRMDAVLPLDPPAASDLDDRLKLLGAVLTDAQVRALTFDDAWARLNPEDLDAFKGWRADRPAPTGLSSAVREAWEHARYAAKARTAMHACLRTWVIRHERPRRRDYHPGCAIAVANSGQHGGIEIPESQALPFLLAARAQSVALDEKGQARPLFAYGIASSFEAFRRLGSERAEAILDSDLPPEDRASGSPAPAGKVTAGAEAVRWYRREIDRALKDVNVRNAHPKVDATNTKATQLWIKGEKCLTFCWFIKTGEAVERALATRIDSSIQSLAATALGTPDSESTRAELERIADRLFRRDSSSYDRTRKRLARYLAPAADGYEDVLDLVVEAAIRHLRTPGYLVRYTPLAPSLTDEDVWAGINGNNSAALSCSNDGRTLRSASPRRAGRPSTELRA